MIIFEVPFKNFIHRPVGLMDKVSASGAGESRFESWAGQAIVAGRAHSGSQHCCRFDGQEQTLPDDAPCQEARNTLIGTILESVVV